MGRKETNEEIVLTPDLLLRAYASGIFPMADPDEGGEIYWYAPDPRGIIPLDTFHVPGTLGKLVRRGTFGVTTDRCFGDVMRACAGRPSTWISEELVAVYVALYEAGFAHSVECWMDGELAGGLYGVAIGAAFFGESMFHRERDASKVALVHLVRNLRKGGFLLLDTQYVTPHLEQFGCTEISRAAYQERLAVALRKEAEWWPASGDMAES